MRHAFQKARLLLSNRNGKQCDTGAGIYSLAVEQNKEPRNTYTHSIWYMKRDDFANQLGKTGTKFKNGAWTNCSTLWNTK